jgi:hypothetical protein
MGGLLVTFIQRIHKLSPNAKKQIQNDHNVIYLKRVSYARLKKFNFKWHSMRNQSEQLPRKQEKRSK